MSERSSSAPRRRNSTCCTKFPPKGKKPLTHQDEEGGGQRVRFGRQRSVVFPPTRWHPKKTDATLPDMSLKREYVYGYNGSCRNSLHFVSETEIAYPVACLVVILDVFSYKQRFFEGHTNDVQCLAWNERHQLCISGQMDEKGTAGPKARIWSPARPSSFCNLPHPRDARSVSAAAISPDGHVAVTFTTDDARSFYLWRGPFGRAVAKEATLTHIFSGSSGRQSTLGVFMFEAACSSSTMTFTTVGVGHFKHWVINFPQNSPITVSQKKGVYGKNPARNPLDWAWRKDDGSAWLVADNGQLYMVMNHSATASKQLASKPLACVEQLPGGRWIAGAVDGTIYVGSGDSMKVEEEIPFAELQGSQAQAFSSTATARFNAITVRRHLAVFGCSNHALFLVDYTRLELLRVLQVSHTTEAWALDFHPTLAILATASARGGVRFWNVADRKAAVGKVLRSEFPAWSLAFQPTDGSLLAVGMDKGLLEVMHFPSLQPTFRERLSRSAERVSSLRFSPCGRYLAAGSWDQEVYLLHIDSESRVTLHRILSGNSSSIVSVMFSEDSRYVMSNSKDCQILHWTTKDGTLQRSQSVFRDTRWQAPWTSVLGWPVVGIWSDPKYDASDINSACQAYAPHHDLLAFGDDYGCVKLLRYPSPFLNPRIEVFTGHASFVTAVRFSPSNVLVTLGGDDHSICQWSLQPRGFEEDLTPTLRHPWAELEGSEAPQDRFAFLGRSEEATPREDPDPEPRRSRVFQDINQVQIGEEEKRATGPTGKRFYHHQQSQGVRNALQWD